MKPQVVGSACGRVAQALDQALSEGVLNLPPELAAHAARCPRCGPECKEIDHFLTRLRGAVAGVNLGPVPRVVDHVLAATAAGAGSQSHTAAGAGSQSHTAAGAGVQSQTAEEMENRKRREHVRWLLGQVAVAAAVLILTVGGLSYTLLKFHQAVSGTAPSEVVARIVEPFRQWVEASFSRSVR